MVEATKDFRAQLACGALTASAPQFQLGRVVPPFRGISSWRRPGRHRRLKRSTLTNRRGDTMLTKLRAGLAAFAVAGAMLVPVVAATPAAAASCAHHMTGSCQANSPHPRAATAKCKDSSYSYARSFRGTCSHHRGVKYWYR
ncbi:DUF3761 domain-containing protein [Streptomyces mirabilis]|uniref:DUF3761 domain-containing protein n=1 Tax=Streptomyces mirabilis TaxID=68239 RepID=UPI0033F4589E